jgi:hypothetical protein
MASPASRLGAVPSFRVFMMRRDVMQLYRDMLRKTRGLEATQKKEIRAFAKQEFVSMRNVTDEAYVRQLVKDGKNQIDHIEHMQYMTF